jgi:hypothetical protein
MAELFLRGAGAGRPKELGPETWKLLIAAFVHAAEKHKAHMKVSDLMNRNDVKAIILDCMTPLCRTLELDDTAKSAGAEINNNIARKYVSGPYIAKITDDQMKRFLTMLLKEMSLNCRPPATDNEIGVAS